MPSLVWYGYGRYHTIASAHYHYLSLDIAKDTPTALLKEGQKRGRLSFPHESALTLSIL